MRNLSQPLATIALLAAQVAHPLPHPATVSARVSASAEGTNTNLTFNINSPSPVEINFSQPNYDTEILQPLRVAQAAKANAEAAAAARAEQAKLAARRAAATAAKPAAPAGADAWYRLRLCESGNTYTRNSGNGYYGAYQYNLSTWANFGGYTRPDLAPAEVQDAKARETQARRGWSPWPACARKLGLL